mgnify:CR=1 FL=1
MTNCKYDKNGVPVSTFNTEPVMKVSIRPHMHGLYRYAHQVIIDSVPANEGREFLLEMNRYSQELLGKCQELGVVPMDDDDEVSE